MTTSAIISLAIISIIVIFYIRKMKDIYVRFYVLNYISDNFGRGEEPIKEIKKAYREHFEEGIRLCNLFVIVASVNTVSLCVIFFVQEYMEGSVLFQTGVALVLEMFFSGLIIRGIYRIFYKADPIKEIKKADIENIFISTTITISICVLFFDYKIGLYILTIFCGRFIWLDSALYFEIRKFPKQLITIYKNESQSSLLSKTYIGLTCFFFLLYRYIHGKADNPSNSTFLLIDFESVFLVHIIYIMVKCIIIINQKKIITKSRQIEHEIKIKMLKIEIVKGKIIDMNTDAIVNATNSSLTMRGKVCNEIFHAAGYKMLKSACDEIGYCKEGDAVITPGFKMKNKFIIHTVGPERSNRTQDKDIILYSAYYNSLKRAKEYGCKSIAFSLISVNDSNYSIRRTWGIAIKAVSDFLSKEKSDILVWFAILDDHIINIGKEVLANL